MSILQLREYEVTKAALRSDQLDLLRDLVKDLTVTPGRAGSDWEIRPAATVGTCRLPDVQVVIQPKLPIARVLFMLTYSLDDWITRELQDVGYGEADDLVEAIAYAFSLALRRCLAAGLLQGYRTREEALQGVRGRLRFDDQLRTRFGRFPAGRVPV